MAKSKDFVESENVIKNRHLRAEEFAHLGHWQFFIADNILTTSDEMNRIYGHDPDIYSMTLDDGIDACHPDDRDRVVSAFSVAMETGETLDYTHRIIKTDGDVRTIHAKTEFECDEDGQILSMFGVVQDITTLKHTEEKLRRSEQKLFHHLENTPLACIFWDKNSVCTEWNKSAEKMFGFSTDEAIGKNANELIVPGEIHTDVDNLFESLLERKGGHLSTNENLTKDGKVLTCEWYNTTIINENEEVVGVASLVLDITERKNSETKLHESEELFRGSFQSSHGIAIISEIETDKVVDVNDAWLKLRGFEKHEVIGKTRSELNVWGSKERRDEIQSELKLRGKLVNYETYSFTRSGEIRELIINAEILNVRGKDLLFITGSDVTERNRFETQLRKTSEILNDSQSIAKVGGWELEIASSELTWTDETFNILEVEKQLDQRPILPEGLDLFTPESKPVIEKAVQRAIEFGEPYDLELEALTAKGNAIWVHTNGKANYEDEKIVSLSGTIQDINTKKLAEQNYEIERQKSAQSAKLASLGQLTGGIAHDFNNILGIVSGNLEIIKRLQPDDSRIP
ncbi:MAG: PAS domain S-box protein, partial [Sneathiella sp.]